MSPLTGVVVPLPNGHSWLMDGGYELLTNWDDPPSVNKKSRNLIRCFSTKHETSRNEGLLGNLIEEIHSLVSSQQCGRA